MTVKQPEARVVFIMITTHAVSTHIGTEIDSLTYLLVTGLTAFYVTEILCFHIYRSINVQSYDYTTHSL